MRIMLNKKGVFILALILVAFVALHWGFAPAHISDRLRFSTMGGGIAFLLMTFSMLLTTRLQLLEDLFGGLDRMYQVHRVCGGVAGALVLVHFVASPKELPEGVNTALNAMVPSGPLGMLAMIVLMVGLAISINRKIAYSRWRPMHKMMGLVYVLASSHFLFAPPVFFDRLAPSGIVLTVAAVLGVLAFFYSVLGMNRHTALAYRVSAVHTLERAAEVVLEPLGHRLQHRAGQFAFIEVQGPGWHESHPFTIASAPGEEKLRFSIKVLGDWTRKLRAELQPGALVQVRGPHGRFELGLGGTRQVWVAGGIGVTPFLSALRHMQPDSGRDVLFIYAARNAAEALHLDEIGTRANALGVRVLALYSDEKQCATYDSLRAHIPGDLTQVEYFFCGPKAMVGNLMTALKAQGVARAHMHAEAFEFR